MDTVFVSHFYQKTSETDMKRPLTPPSKFVGIIQSSGSTPGHFHCF